MHARMRVYEMRRLAKQCCDRATPSWERVQRSRPALSTLWATAGPPQMSAPNFCDLDQVQEEENLQEIHVEILYHEKPVSGKRLAMYYVVLTNQHPADGEW